MTTEQARVEQFPIPAVDMPTSGTTVPFPRRLAGDTKTARGPAIPAVETLATVSEQKKAKKKSKKKKKVKSEPGSEKCIETMFRTAYRAQLDLTALAATKANIMISLNGLILSVLTLSGPFVLVAEPVFTVPVAVFLATALTSIMFAVLAAQPRRAKRKGTLEDFKQDRANILVFEQFSALSMAEHSSVIGGLLRDKKRIYANMSRQLYLLGIDADRKFRLLKRSYTTFLLGLTLSTVTLMVVGMLYHTSDMGEMLSSMQSGILAYR